MRHGWDGEPGRWFVAYDGDQPVATASIEASAYDNLELARLAVRVAPAHRRQGHGTAVLGRLELLALESGRTLFHVGDWESDATVAFAAAAGYQRRNADIRRVQDVADAPDPGPIRDEAHRHAADYELLRIDGYTPVDLLPGLVDITEAINDAPFEDLDYEDEVYNEERVRAYERAQVESGMRLRRIVARHRPTGDLVGHTVVVVDGEQPTIAEQHDTTVLRAHRGHRLGLLLKADMLLWLAEIEPQVERIYTWNAESNGHMIAVNERLGYHPVGRALEFQRRAR